MLRGGERVWRLAVEVELHQKASRLYDAKLAWYADQFAAGALDGCLWLCAGAGRTAPVRPPPGGWSPAWPTWWGCSRCPRG